MTLKRPTPTNFMMVQLIILYLLLVLISARGCDRGWFGRQCQYKCHCTNNNCDSNGDCTSGDTCVKGWFGPQCQYVDLTYTEHDGSSPVWLTDGDDTTCNENTDLGAAANFTVTLKKPFLFTWVRINVKSEESLESTISVKFRGSSGGTFQCINKRYARVDNHTVDIYCDLDVEIKEVFVSGVDDVCSLYVSGGRNLALKQSAKQSSTAKDIRGSKALTIASNAVDGDTDQSYMNGSCTHTSTTDHTPTWSLTMSHPSKVSRYVIYNRGDCCQYRLKGFVLTAIDENDAPTLTYTDRETTPQDVYTVTSPSNASHVSGIRIETHTPTSDRFGYKLPPILTLCEVEIYGDTECGAGKYGRECEYTCHCASNEPCFVSTGRCPSGCAAGYTGVHCDQICEYGKDDKDFNNSCSGFYSKNRTQDNNVIRQNINEVYDTNGTRNESLIQLISDLGNDSIYQNISEPFNGSLCNDSVCQNISKLCNDSLCQSISEHCNNSICQNTSEPLNLNDSLCNDSSCQNITELCNDSVCQNITELCNGSLCQNITENCDDSVCQNVTELCNNSLCQNVTEVCNDSLCQNITENCNDSVCENVTGLCNNSLCQNVTELCNDSLCQNITEHCNDSVCQNMTELCNNSLCQNATELCNNSLCQNISDVCDDSVCQYISELCNDSLCQKIDALCNDSLCQNISETCNYSQCQNVSELCKQSLSRNISELCNETLYQNISKLCNETHCQNISESCNETLYQNISELCNETHCQNISESCNETLYQNISELCNETLYQNISELCNETLYQNISELCNETLYQNISELCNGTLYQNISEICNDSLCQHIIELYNKNGTETKDSPYYNISEEDGTHNTDSLCHDFNEFCNKYESRNNESFCDEFSELCDMNGTRDNDSLCQNISEFCNHSLCHHIRKFCDRNRTPDKDELCHDISGNCLYECVNDSIRLKCDDIGQESPSDRSDSEPVLGVGAGYSVGLTVLVIIVAVNICYLVAISIYCYRRRSRTERYAIERPPSDDPEGPTTSWYGANQFFKSENGYNLSTDAATTSTVTKKSRPVTM